MRRPSPLTVLTSALLVLLPALAVLQYRWVGQVSDAERTRMERNLRTAALQFREAFDDEVVGAVNSLRADAAEVRDNAWYRYADRYAAWSDSAEHPGIVAAVYLVDADADALRLRRWNAARGTFDRIEWPDGLSVWRARFEQTMTAFRAERLPARILFPEDDSLIVAPLLNAGLRPPQPRPAFPNTFGFIVVQLDMMHIRNQLLPILAERHFTHTEGDRYRMAVVSRSNGDVIYRSDPQAPVDVDRAAAVVPFYGRFRDPLFLQRGPDGGRGDVRRRDREEAGTDGRGRFDRDPGRWALLVQHESGSLAAAVAAVRRRNLGISFGILILLTGSVVLLAASSRRAQRLAQQQMEFVASVSHELRTPVAVIRSAAENLAHGVVSGDRVKRYGEMIEVESRRLGEMVERVLQYAGIASGLAGRTRVPLAPSAILESAIASAAPGAGPVDVHLAVEPNLPQVLGDESALRAAVENLIANAIKYGGPDGWVGVRADQSAAGGRREVRITVDDRGAGIPSDELPHVFEPFYRGADAIARQIHGSGLGLALVQQIVAAHGGRVTVTTRPGAGSSFTIALPAVEPDAHAVADRAQAPHAAERAAHS